MYKLKRTRKDKKIKHQVNSHVSINFNVMYFDTNQVSNTLLCQICEGRIEIPKILPCGEIICSFCERSITADDRKFDCLICKNKHEMPKIGLPICKPLLQILTMKPRKVSRGREYDSLQKLLNEIQKNRNSIEFGVENSADFVKEHCIELRTNVQLATEEVIQQVNDLSAKMIEEINEYEKEMIEFNKTNSKSLDDFKKLIEELDTFHSVNSEYLKQLLIDDEILLKSTNEATNLIKKAELEMGNLKNIIFNGKLYKTDKKGKIINTSMLGIKKVITNEIDSIILSNSDQLKDLISLCEFSNNKYWNLLYRGSRDGFESYKFHEKCDNISNTLVIIKSENGNVFGGYTEQSWSGHQFKFDPHAFIFSLINENNRPLKLNCSRNKAICCDNKYGPIFGGTDCGCNPCDFAIFDLSNITRKRTLMKLNFLHGYNKIYIILYFLLI